MLWYGSGISWMPSRHNTWTWFKEIKRLYYSHLFMASFLLSSISWIVWQSWLKSCNQWQQCSSCYWYSFVTFLLYWLECWRICTFCTFTACHLSWMLFKNSQVEENDEFDIASYVVCIESYVAAFVSLLSSCLIMMGYYFSSCIWFFERIDSCIWLLMVNEISIYFSKFYILNWQSMT